MAQQRNSLARRRMLDQRASDQFDRVPRFTPVPGKRKYSSRFQAGQTWRTKRWTPSRWRDLQGLETFTNLDMLEAIVDRQKPALAGLKAHIALHPNDTGAMAALKRAEG